MPPEYAHTPEIAYDWVIVAYFFLGGLSAGAFVVSVLSQFWKTELKPLSRTMAIVSPVALAIGMIFLLLDLGQPLRAWRLFLNFNPRSALSWGVWFLNVFFVLNLLYAWNLLRGSQQKAKLFGFVGIPFAILVASYTGVLLAQAPGRALWHSPLVPVLFLNGALISGLAAAIVTSVGRAEAAVVSKAGKILAGLVALELGMVIAEVIVLLNGSADAVAAAEALLYGPMAGLFLGLEIAAGTLLPILLLLLGKRSPGVQAVASVLVLIGVFIMRYVVVVGGQINSF